jgi:hypothetical protein
MNKANGRIRKLTDVEILRMCVEENDAQIRKQLTSVVRIRTSSRCPRTDPSRWT